MFKLHYQFADSLHDEFCNILKSPENLMLEGEVLKDDKSTTLVKISLHDKEYVVKRFNSRSNWHKIKRALRKTRAESCWEMSHLFHDCGINVPTPIAKIEKKIGCLKLDSFFICEYIEGSELLEWLPSQCEAEIERVTQQIRHIFDIFSQNRLSHGDMKATNLLRSGDEIFLIDLDVAKQHHSHLAFLKANKRDKKRFCRNGELFNDMLSK